MVKSFVASSRLGSRGRRSFASRISRWRIPVWRGSTGSSGEIDVRLEPDELPEAMGSAGFIPSAGAGEVDPALDSGSINGAEER